LILLAQMSSVRLRSHRHEYDYPYIRVPVNTSLQLCMYFRAAVHIDTSSLRSVRVTCEFHSYEQFLSFLFNPYEVNNTEFVLIKFIQAI